MPFFIIVVGRPFRTDEPRAVSACFAPNYDLCPLMLFMYIALHQPSAFRGI